MPNKNRNSYCSSISNHPSFISWWVVDQLGCDAIKTSKEMKAATNRALRGKAEIKMRISEEGIKSMIEISDFFGEFIFTIHEGTAPFDSYPKFEPKDFRAEDFIEEGSLYRY